MPVQPWFKFYAGDYLLDARVDGMPREAESLLVRMWAICHLEGYCPDNPEELARKTRCSLQYVLQCKQHCQLFFELQDGKLYSRRMQEEKRRSERASKNASQRYKQKSCATGTASGTATSSAAGKGVALPPSDYDSDSKSSSTSKDLSKSQELTYEPDVEDGFDVLVNEIGHLHPKNVHLKGKDLPRDLEEAIAEALQRDGKDAVLVGTRNLRDAVARWPRADLRFVPNPVKFYRDSEYLKDPAVWEKVAPAGSNGQCHPYGTRPLSERKAAANAN